jgi:hypothetical protein
MTVLAIGWFWFNHKSEHHIGQAIDSLNGVEVYYNDRVGHVEGRNTTADGYNLGQKYQCVEFVKRYYYEHYKHKMPESYGHAKSFYNTELSDGAFNKERGLMQYTNPSKAKPQIGDLLVMGETVFNSHGHVAIISNVTANSVEIIQQNPGPYSPSRVTYRLSSENNLWRIEQKNVLGWLRKG